MDFHTQSCTQSWAIPCDFVWQPCSFWITAWSRTDWLHSKVNHSCEQNVWTIAMAKRLALLHTTDANYLLVVQWIPYHLLSPVLGRRSFTASAFASLIFAGLTSPMDQEQTALLAQKQSPYFAFTDCWKCALRCSGVPLLSSNESWMSLLTPPGTNTSSMKPQFWPLLAPDCPRRGALGRTVPPHLIPACLVLCRPSCCQKTPNFGGDTSHHWTSRAESLHPSSALVPTRPGKMSCSEWKQGLTNPRLFAYCSTDHLSCSVWVQQANAALFCTFCHTCQKWLGPLKTLRQSCVFMSAICWHLLH